VQKKGKRVFVSIYQNKGVWNRTQVSYSSTNQLQYVSEFCRAVHRDFLSSALNYLRSG